MAHSKGGEGAGSAEGGGGKGGACSTNTATIGETSASGNNNTCVTTPHIVQYPKPPKRDDGRWMALGTLLGSVVGKLASQKYVKQAKKAEANWEKIVKYIEDAAYKEMGRLAPLRAKADTAMGDLDGRNAINWSRSDQEFGYEEQLKPCVDNLAAQVCSLSSCGYTPDYEGIIARVKADAERARKAEMDKFCRTQNRYNTGAMCDFSTRLSASTIDAIIGTSSLHLNAERDRKWKYDSDIKMKAFDLMEKARQDRHRTSSNYDTKAVEVRFKQYGAYTDDAQASLKIGADLLASSGQNSAWLADSLRKTADKTSGSWASLAAMITAALVAWNALGSAAKSPEC